MSSASSQASSRLDSKARVEETQRSSDHEKGVLIDEAVKNVDLFTESSFSEEDLEMIHSHLSDRSLDEWLGILREAVKYHKNDAGIAIERWDFLNALTEGPLDGQTEAEWEGTVSFEAFIIHEWSIYPEVRAVTRPPVIEDDEDEEYTTFRAIASGIVWGAAGAVIATFFEPRFPGINITSSSLQVVLAIGGHLVAKLPRIQMPLGFGRKFVINTGKPWSYREQMLATLAMALTDSSPYAQDTVIAQANKYFYDFDGANTFGYIILLLLSTTMMGFGLGGLYRSAVTYPSKMVYYTNLPTLALSRTLVQADIRESVNGWKLKRWEFFFLTSTIFFGWYWITSILFGFMSFFAWICWAAPNNVNANAITGPQSGLGLNPFPSFDPNVFGSFAGIAIPPWAYTNIIAGLVISTFAVCIMWWTNVVNTGYFPINSNSLYDNEGNEWDVTQVLNPKTKQLDEEMFQQYSFPYWSAGLVASYGANFFIYPAGFLSGYLNNWSDMRDGFRGVIKGLKFFPGGKRSIDGFNDAFSRRMQRNKEVPEWWYLLILVCSLGMGIGTVEGYKFTQTPVWTLFLGVGLTLVFLPIVCILVARSGQDYETNVLYELIVGYALPGDGNVLLVGKAYATNFFYQAEMWIKNQKVAHYSGIAPRSLFITQVASTIITCFVQAGIITWQLDGGIRDMCNLENKQLMKCQNTRTYFNASIMWGVIGPQRVFKAVYPKIKWCFLIGACYPIPFWVVRRFGGTVAAKINLKKGSWPHWFVSGAFLHNVDETLILIGANNYWSPSNWTYVIVDYYISLFFGLFIKKRWPLWWSKYAYLLSAACSNGVGWAAFFQFWATQYHHIVNVSWWGNNVSNDTLDMNYTAVRLSANDTVDGYFGPRRGHFPK